MMLCYVLNIDNKFNFPTLSLKMHSRIVHLVHRQGVQKEQVRQCLGFCTAYFRSLLVYKKALQKHKH